MLENELESSVSGNGETVGMLAVVSVFFTFRVYCEETECYFNRNFEKFRIHYCRTSEFLRLCFGYYDPDYFGRR